MFDACSYNRENIMNFVMSCRVNSTDYELAPNLGASPYARCFAIYVCHTLLKPMHEFHDVDQLVDRIIHDAKSFVRNSDLSSKQIIYSKPIMQLLTMSMTALSVLDRKRLHEFLPLVEEIDTNKILPTLEKFGVREGRPQSGNLAMFLAIILIFRHMHGQNMQKQIDAWVEIHLKWMNKHGFWGSNRCLTYSQFQNGYHQYEIFDYLNVKLPDHEKTRRSLSLKCDEHGHFAPYPGGGSCYDYDAVKLMMMGDQMPSSCEANILKTLYESLCRQQNSDGGFCESSLVGQLGSQKSRNMITHIFSQGSWSTRYERARWCLNLLRRKHKTINTHWSKMHRTWDMSNLWDTWFRLLVLRKIEIFENKSTCKHWGRFDFPGLGYDR